MLFRSVKLEREIAPERVCGMRVAGEIRAASASAKADLLSRSAELFHGPKNSEIETDRPLVKVAFAKLGALWPECIHFRDLLAHSMTALGRSGAEETTSDTGDLASALVQSHGAGFVEFRMHKARFTTEPGDKPRASALAQLQFAENDRATSLRHTVVEIRDAMGKALVRLMTLRALRRPDRRVSNILCPR